MMFFCYHRDRPGSTPLRIQMLEEHWSYMDRFDATMIARGPTFTTDETLTGSVHILDLPDPAAARAFAFEEPGYQAGVGRLILSLCQEAARKEGFTRLELMGTMSGEPLYTTYGFVPIERLTDDRGGASVPLVRMAKTIDEGPEPRGWPSVGSGERVAFPPQG